VLLRELGKIRVIFVIFRAIKGTLENKVFARAFIPLFRPLIVSASTRVFAELISPTISVMPQSVRPPPKAFRLSYAAREAGEGKPESTKIPSNANYLVD
jgi:hypothetical protein